MNRKYFGYVVVSIVAVLVSVTGARADFTDSASFSHKYEGGNLDPASYDLTNDAGTVIYTGGDATASTDGDILSFSTGNWTSDDWGTDVSDATGWSVELRAKVVSDSGTLGATGLMHEDLTSGTKGGVYWIGGEDFGRTANASTKSVVYQTADNTDAFHTFRIVQPGNSSIVRVFRDGLLVRSEYASYTANFSKRWGFGDIGGAWAGSMQIDYVRFDNTGPHAPAAADTPVPSRSANSVIETSGQMAPWYITDKHGSPWALSSNSTWPYADTGNDTEDYFRFYANKNAWVSYALATIGAYPTAAPDLLTDALNDPDGWRLTVRVKAVLTPNNNTDAIAYVYDGTDIWGLKFVKSGANNIVYFVDGSTIATVSYDYHTYTMTYDPDSDSVTIAIDDTDLATKTRTDAPNDATTAKQIRFGDNETGNSNTSDSRWSLVRFETGPFDVDLAIENHVFGATNILETSAWLNGNLISTGSAPTRVFAFWGDNDGTTTKSGPGGWDENVEVDSDAPLGLISYKAEGLTGDTLYYYRFYATNALDENWANSSETFATAMPASSDPTGLSVDLVDITTLQLNWTDNSATESGFEVQISQDQSTWTTDTVVNAGITTFDSSGLSQDTWYYYRVRATNDAGFSGFTAVESNQTADAIESYTWVGSGGGGDDTSWEDSGNWSGGASYPKLGDRAVLDNGDAPTVALSAQRYAGTLDIAYDDAAGTETVTASLTFDNTAARALDLGTLRVGQGLGTAGLYTGALTIDAETTVNVADAAWVGVTRLAHGLVTLNGGTLAVGTDAANATELYIGAQGSSLGGDVKGTLDLNSGTFSARADTMSIGYKSADTRAHDGTGVILVDGASVDVQATTMNVGVSVGSSGGGAFGTIDLSAATEAESFDVGTLTVASGVRDSAYAANEGTILFGNAANGNAQTFTVTGNIIIGASRHAIGLIQQDAGTMTFGADGSRVNLDIGKHGSSTPSTARGTLRVNGGTFAAYIETLTLSQNASGGAGNGTVDLQAITLGSGGNVFDVSTVNMNATDSGPNVTGALQLGPGSARFGTLTAGPSSGAGTADIDLAGTLLEITTSAALRIGADVDVTVSDSSAGFDIQASGSAALAVTPANGYYVTFTQDPAGVELGTAGDHTGIHYGLKWAGEHTATGDSALSTLESGGQVAWDDTTNLTGDFNGAADVFYDSGTDATYIGFYVKSTGLQGTVFSFQ